jgi:maltose O-acetyltransferase
MTVPGGRTGFGWDRMLAWFRGGDGVPDNRNAKALADSVRLDLTRGMVWFLRNSVAGSILVPRSVRFLMYRAMGLKIKSPAIADGQIIESDNLTVGTQAVVSRGCYFEGAGKIEIGDYCMVGPGVMFITSTHLREEEGGELNRKPVPRDIVVERDVWIGARATVLPGAVIEEGCIIAAGSLVLGRCTKGLLYAGVPAQRVGRASAVSTS